MKPAEYVAVRRVGAATVAVISAGSGASNVVAQLEVPEELWRPEVPEADAAGLVPGGYNVAYVAIDGAGVLVDLGLDDPSASSPWMPPRVDRTPGVAAGLASLGLTPEAVTHAIVSHTHDDHFAGATVERGDQRVPRYPRARYLLGRADWERDPAFGRPDSMQTVHLATLRRQGRLDLIDGEHEPAPGVTMVPAPGESPGHYVVRVSSQGESFVFLADLLHHPCQAEHLDWVSTWREPTSMRASRERVLAQAADEAAVLVYSHAVFPGWGRVERRSGGFRWRWLPD